MNIDKENLLKLYTIMLRIRLFEEKIVQLYPEQEMKTPVHLYTGEEAIAAGVCANLKKEDYVFSNHRNHGHCIARGTSLKPIMAELYGKRTGCSKGKSGSMHLFDVENNILGTSAIVGGGIPIAVGTALASSIKGEKRVSITFFGDGAIDTGTFYESLNFASLKKLPVVFVCENNFYATHSHISKRMPANNIHKRGEPLLIPGVRADGNDVIEVYNVSKKAIETARNGEGPTLIEFRTYRWMGHATPSFDYTWGYRTKEELELWMEKCPIKRFKKYLLENKIMTEQEMEGLSREINKEIEEAVKFAKESPFPEDKELLEDVY